MIIKGRDWRIYVGDVRQRLADIPAASVHCCITSPPYWNLRDYQKEDQIGLEPLHDCLAWARQEPPCGGCYVCSLRAVAAGVYRALRADGTFWLNLGDSYASDPKKGKSGKGKNSQYMGGVDETIQTRRPGVGLPNGNLVGIPWRVALALQADGWVLRSEIIWCLSGGTWVYARTQKGDMPMMLKDLARLDPTTVKLWNGTKWTQLLGMSKSKRTGEELEIVLGSGERISCTPNHKFPTSRGLVEACGIEVGDVLKNCRLPEPESPLDCAIDEDAAWLAGLFIADGWRSDKTITICKHLKRDDIWERVRRVGAKYGGSVTRAVSDEENCMYIHIHGKIIQAILDELVSGSGAWEKCFSSKVWRYSDKFIAAMVDGYLNDAQEDQENSRWRLNFCRNYGLERDLRVACARLGWKLRLSLDYVMWKGERRPTFSGELRKTTSGHWNEKNRNEVVEIRKSRCRFVYDLGVEDDPHVFALASGVLTHNSKPSAMPESVKSRCSKAHEQVFMFAKAPGYYYDAVAIQEPVVRGAAGSLFNEGKTGDRDGGDRTQPGGRDELMEKNKRTVWTVATTPSKNAHFAPFPPKLIEPMILAGTSEKGACGQCGTPYRRITEREQITRERPNEYVKRTGEEGTGNSCANTVAGVAIKTLGWASGCGCNAALVPCTVLDPFLGSGTTIMVALQNHRRGIGIELNEEYVEICKKRIEQGRLKAGFF